MLKQQSYLFPFSNHSFITYLIHLLKPWKISVESSTCYCFECATKFIFSLEMNENENHPFFGRLSHI